MRLIIDIPNYNLNPIQNGSIACSLILKAVKKGVPYEERPHGEWIYHKYDKEFECSECHLRFDEDNFGIEIPQANATWVKVCRYNFCPNCGSDNRPRKHGCCFADETCKNNPCEDCGLVGGEK